MSVSHLIIEAFTEAISHESALHEKWRSISHKIGAFLPNSILAMTIQRDGDIDLILRMMENELRAPQITGPHFLHAHYQKYLSELWVGSAYEIFRLLVQRKLGTQNNDFLKLAEDLRLLRVGLEKHEIPSDKRLKKAIPLLRLPTNNDTIDFYEYSKDDQNRGIVLPTGISGNGSIMWNVLEARPDGSAAEHWLERLDLSDRVISILDDVP